MFLAYTVFQRDNEQYCELSLLPAKPESGFASIQVGALPETSSAVLYVGPGESVTVRFDTEKNARIIKPIRPAEILLTPTTSEMPGEKAEEVIIFTREGEHKVFYKRRGFDTHREWQPNVRFDYEST